MDETLQELENELKRLTPRRPASALMRALESELGPEATVVTAPRYSTATSLRSWKWATWSLAGVAAAMALVAIMQVKRQPMKVSPPLIANADGQSVATRPAVAPVNRYEPVKATSVLYDMKEDGAATLPDQSEGRQVRYRYVDTYTWKNPTTKASLRWSVPRDEVRLVRASLD
jgi:hypothetical protein